MKPQWPGIACLFAAAIGAEVGIRILKRSPEVLPHTPRFDLWVGMTMTQTALWGALVPMIAVSIWQTRRTWRTHWPTYTIGMVMLAGFFLRAVSYPFHPSELLPGLSCRMDYHNYLGMAVSAGLALALWCEASRFDEVTGPLDYANVRDRVSALQTLFGVFLGLGVIVKGTMHYALAQSHDPQKLLQPEILLLWGVFYSFALAVLFIPAYAAAIRAARRIYGVAATGDLDQVKSLREWLRLDTVDPLGAVSSAAAILAPLVAGVLSVAVPKLTSS